MLPRFGKVVASCKVGRDLWNLVSAKSPSMAKDKTTHKNAEGPSGKDGQHEGRDGEFQLRYVNDKKEVKMLDIKNFFKLHIKLY